MSARSSNIETRGISWRCFQSVPLFRDPYYFLDFRYATVINISVWGFCGREFELSTPPPTAHVILVLFPMFAFKKHLLDDKEGGPPRDIIFFVKKTKRDNN